LKLRGHTVAVANDGSTGVAMAHDFQPDIVLCDIGLPGEMNGYKVAEALRADPATRWARLVAVTGFGQDEDRRRALAAGFDRHMTKPVGYADLVTLIADMDQQS
jgi:CheY-like chemotaxis protein